MNLQYHPQGTNYPQEYGYHANFSQINQSLSSPANRIPNYPMMHPCEQNQIQETQSNAQRQFSSTPNRIPNYPMMNLNEQNNIQEIPSNAQRSTSSTNQTSQVPPTILPNNRKIFMLMLIDLIHLIIASIKKVTIGKSNTQSISNKKPIDSQKEYKLTVF
jgi:hypothetical protein